MDPLEGIIAVASALFGAGVAWGTQRGAVKTANTRATTAIQEASDAKHRISIERERVTELTGRLNLSDERILNLQKLAEETVTREVFVSEMRAQTAEMARSISQREIRAAGRLPPVPREEPPSDPPTPQPPRPKLPSRGRFGAE